MAHEAHIPEAALPGPPAAPGGAEPQHSPLSASGDPVLIDCDSCSVRGAGCGDCVVTFLLGTPPSGVVLDDAERRAIDVLAAAGLVPPLRMVRPLESRPGEESS